MRAGAMVKVLRRCCRSFSGAASLSCVTSDATPASLDLYLQSGGCMRQPNSPLELLRSTCMNQGSCDPCSVVMQTPPITTLPVACSCKDWQLGTGVPKLICRRGPPAYCTDRSQACLEPHMQDTHKASAVRDCIMGVVGMVTLCLEDACPVQGQATSSLSCRCRASASTS